MADYIIQDSTLTDIADAIRAKTGKSAAMTPAEMVTEIESISDGGALPSWMHIAEVTVVSATKTIQIPCDIPVDSYFCISSEFVSRTVLEYEYVLFQYRVPTLRPYEQIAMTQKPNGNTDYWQTGGLSYSDGVATITSSYYYGAGVKYTFVLFNKGGA